MRDDDRFVNLWQYKPAPTVCMVARKREMFGLEGKSRISMSGGKDQGGFRAASREVCIITLIHARKHHEDQVKEALLTVTLAA